MMLRLIAQSKWTPRAMNVIVACVLLFAIACGNPYSGWASTSHQTSNEMLFDPPNKSDTSDLGAADQHCCSHAGVTGLSERFSLMLVPPDGQPNDRATDKLDGLRPHIILPPPKS